MVSVLDVEYVSFGQTDLRRAEAFLLDFGLTAFARSQNEILFRGAADRRYCYVAEASQHPGLRAIGMRVASIDTLVEATGFPEASAVETIGRSGGGKRVSLRSPDGILFELVHGIEPVEMLQLRPPLVFNHADRKSRIGMWQRAPLEPSKILRIGHVALTTANYPRNAEWLESRLGLAPSDVLFDGSVDNAVGGFFHCSGTGGWTDHHTIALFPAIDAGVHHCSFEVQDVDAEFLGNKYLLSRGWQPLWGIGRHILGSQIFDYWFDPDGNVIEHFTDGDLVQPGFPPEFHQVSDDSLAQWGPPMPVVNFIERRPHVHQSGQYLQETMALVDPPVPCSFPRDQ